MPEQSTDRPDIPDDDTRLEAFYQAGACFPVPDITEKTLGYLSGELIKYDSQKRGPAGSILIAFMNAPDFVTAMTRGILDAAGRIEISQWDAVEAGIEGAWEAYFQNYPDLPMNMRRLDDQNVNMLRLMMSRLDVENPEKIPDIPPNHLFFNNWIEHMSHVYGQTLEQDEQISQRYQQGARIGFWILKSFWYKLDPLKHRPGRD